MNISHLKNKDEVNYKVKGDKDIILFNNPIIDGL